MAAVRMTPMLRSSPMTDLFLGLIAVPMYFASVSCASAPAVVLDASPAEAYEAMWADIDRPSRSNAADSATAKRQTARFAEMARRVIEMELTAADEYFYAGAILVRSSDINHLLLAESVGRQATILGDKRGRPVAAEAVDRQAFINGTKQTYGTQYVFSHITGDWQLYPYNREITDADRDAVGLPPLSWFEDRVRELNASDRTERIRREIKNPPTQWPTE